MFTTQDEGRGLVKTCWADIRERVAKVEPKFASIIDALNPDKSFSLFLAYFPYGTLIGDTKTMFIPRIDGGVCPLIDPNLPKEVLEQLGYGRDSSPMGMVLEKEIEYFIDLKEDYITIPGVIYRPGNIFSFSRNLTKVPSEKNYTPNAIFNASSGARSVFMLPNIGCASQHSNLQRDFNVRSQPPKTLYEHWDIFRQIINSNVIPCDWRSCILYFGEKWVNHLQNDKAWLTLKAYLFDLAWSRFSLDRNRTLYDIAFSVAKKKRNLKPNPYLADTAVHLFNTAIGAAPGYAPAINECALPLNIIRSAYESSYALKKYISTIIQPSMFDLELKNSCIYYSLQQPSTFVFSPKSRKVFSTLVEMRELAHIMDVFIEEFSDNQGMCSNTAINHAAREIRFNYYHNEIDKHHTVHLTSKIIERDPRFGLLNSPNNAVFAKDAPFIRGCISMCGKEKY
jgi:hypothetical protein